MKLFKRIEVWILLVLVLAGIGYVIFTSAGSGGGYNADDPDDGSAGDESSKKLEIEEVKLTRDFGNYKAAITFSYDNSDGSDTVKLNEDAVLKDAADRVIRLYWLGSMPPLPEIKPGKKEKATLTYWLDKKHVDGELRLSVADATKRIKTKDSLPDSRVKNGDSVIMTSSNWAKAK